jgi:hypothetical protein
MRRTLATLTTEASNSSEVTLMAVVADSVNAASHAVKKLNGWDDKVEGIAAELCAVGFW